MAEKQKHEIDKPINNTVAEAKRQENLSRQFKKLKHYLTYLNMEHDEMFDVFKHAKETFISKMFAYCSENKLTPPFKQEAAQQNKKEKVDKQKNKELYREIVKQTHPDKTQNLSEEEIESRAELYQEATDGKMSGDFNKLLKVALELDIEITNINEELIQTLEEAISKMEKKITSIEKDIMYKWYYCNPKQQESIFNQLAKPPKKKAKPK